MKNIKKNIYQGIPVLMAMFLFFSCSEMDHQYRDFILDGEKIYPGKVYQVSVLPGKNRVKLEMKTYPDPNVESVWVKWTAQGVADSLQADVEKGAQYHTAEVLIDGLAENSYTFYFYTVDADGNRSVPAERSAQVFGEKYMSTLRPHFVQEAIYDNDTLSIMISPASDTVALGTEFYYIDKAGKVASRFVPNEETEVKLADFKPGSQLSYRSLYVPQSNALDTFYTHKASLKTGRYIEMENSKVPFIAQARSGRWGTLAGWTTNAAAKIHPGGHGGWDEWNSNIFNLESGWGAPSKVTNGKIYKTMVLKPGDYTFSISDLRDTNLQTSDNNYLVAALGTTIPDYENLDSALAFTSVIQGKNVNDLKISFTVTEEQEVSFGYLSNQSGDKFANIRAFKLKYIPL